MMIISNRSISSYLSFRNIPHIANPNFHKLPRSALRDCHSAPFAGVSRWSGLDLWTELSPGAATKWKTRCCAASELRCKTSANWVKTCQNQRVPMGSLFGSHQNSRDLIIFIPQSGHPQQSPWWPTSPRKVSEICCLSWLGLQLDGSFAVLLDVKPSTPRVSEETWRD